MGLITTRDVKTTEWLCLEKYQDGAKDAGEMPYEIIMVKLVTEDGYQREEAAELLTKEEDIRIAMAFTKANGATLMESKNG